jgi:hypothetical protein
VGLLACGQYDAWYSLSIDLGETDYYDHATGALVARIGQNNGAMVCNNGPSCFVPPSACTDLCPPDADALSAGD